MIENFRPSLDKRVQVEVRPRNSYSTHGEIVAPLTPENRMKVEQKRVFC